MKIRCRDIGMLVGAVIAFLLPAPDYWIYGNGMVHVFVFVVVGLLVGELAHHVIERQKRP